MLKKNIRLLGLGWQFVKPYSLGVLFTFIFSTAISLIQIIEPNYTARLIDGLSNLNRNIFLRNLIYIVGFQVASYIISVISKTYGFSLEKRIRVFSEMKLYSNLVGKKRPQPSGTVLALFLNDLGAIVGIYRNTIPTFFITFLVIGFVSFRLYEINKLILVAVLLSSVLPLLISHFSGKKLYAINKKQKEIQDRYNKYIAETNNGLLDIQTNSAKSLFCNRFLQLLNSYFSIWWVALKTQLFSSSCLNVLLIMTNIGLLLLSSIQMFNGTMTVGVLISTMMYAGILNGKIQLIVNDWQKLMISMVSLKRLEDFFSCERYYPVNETTTIYSRGIEFREFSFSYDGEHNVLESLEFFFGFPGLYGLKGRNGSGKSTLLCSIAGIVPFDCIEGTIAFYGLKSSDIVYISNQSKLFSITVKDNLALGDQHDIADIWRVLDETGIGDVIRELPLGLDTVIDSSEPPFSAGQIQRLLICRALLGKKEIILLDEVDTSLDEEGYMEFGVLLGSLKEKSLVILASHHNRFDHIMKGQLVLT